MLAMTEMPHNLSDPFASALRTFLEHARAIASGKVEGGGFSWFLACEYQWEVEAACHMLVDAPSDQVSDVDRAVLDKFLAGMPAVKAALVAFKRNARNMPVPGGAGQWSDWQDVSTLPAWRDFSIRTAILLSQLGKAAHNDGQFDLQR
jgi:hypothetical protein